MASAPHASAERAPVHHRPIRLCDGSLQDLASLSDAELAQLQWEQEPQFARSIIQAPKDSRQREAVIAQAYESICSILAEMSSREAASQQFSMGMDSRYSDLVLRRLAKYRRGNEMPAFFELGYSSGVILEQVARAGHDIGGLEVVAGLREQAQARLDSKHHPWLLLGDFRKVDLSAHRGRYHVVYWNDVFEHIPQDEILDYLRLLFELLRPGGELITITPNWLMRPSDVTRDFSPPRTEAIGFHLKEYRASEVRDLLLQAGFARVQVPALITRRRIHTWPVLHLTRFKMSIERWVDRLPYPIAVQFCRRLGMNCTIAHKSRA